MRIILTVLLTTTMLTSSFGQETKKVMFRYENPPAKEVFYVRKDNSEIKQGKYEKLFNGSYELIERGEYDNNVKVGIWEYMFKGELEQKIDYTNQKVIFSKPLTFISKTMIIEDETLKENNSGETPILLGGQGKFLYYFVRLMRYPADARRHGTQGTVLVSATITKEGKMINEEVEEGLGDGLDEEAVRILQLLPDEWIPLKVNGELVETRVFIAVKFKLA